MIFHVGDRVLLENKTRKKGVVPKLMDKYTGPYVVEAQAGPVNYVIRDVKTLKLINHPVNVNRLKMFHSEHEIVEEAMKGYAPPRVADASGGESDANDDNDVTSHKSDDVDDDVNDTVTKIVTSNSHDETGNEDDDLNDSEDDDEPGRGDDPPRGLLNGPYDKSAPITDKNREATTNLSGTPDIQQRLLDVDKNKNQTEAKLSKMKDVITNTNDQEVNKSPEKVTEDNNWYEAEKLLNTKVEKGKRYFRVKWAQPGLNPRGN